MYVGGDLGEVQSPYGRGIGTEAPGVGVPKYVPRVDQGLFLDDYKASRTPFRSGD